MEIKAREVHEDIVDGTELKVHRVQRALTACWERRDQQALKEQLVLQERKGRQVPRAATALPVLKGNLARRDHLVLQEIKGRRADRDLKERPVLMASRVLGEFRARWASEGIRALQERLVCRGHRDKKGLKVLWEFKD